MRRNIGASEGASIYIFGLCGGSLLATMLTRFLTNVGMFDGMPTMIWVTYATTQLAFMLVVVGYSKFRHVDMFNVARIRKFTNYKQWLLLPLISIATIICFLPMSNLFVKLLSAIGYVGQGASTPAFSNFGIYILSLLVMALLPSIGEEFLMRGALFGGLSTRGTWFGILMSALLFSLMHSNPLQTVHQFGLGVVLAIVLLLSGSIWACVLIHFVNNFMSLTISAYIPQIDQAYESLGNWTYLTDFASIAIGAILLVCLLYLYFRAGRGKKQQFRTATDGIVYEEFAIYATADVKAANMKSKFLDSTFVCMWKFAVSLFTKKGWKNVSYELGCLNTSPFLGKAQPMFNVWLALGFGTFYWLLIFISGLIA